jgi:Cthe_2314-like HEPN
VSEKQSFSAIGEYYEELTRLMESDQEPKKLARLIGERFANEYSKAVMISLGEMDSLHKEIRQILDDFSGRPAGFLKYLTIDHLVLLIKFYVVQWSTLTDMTASLISKTFTLGLADSDIKFGLILRNSHVQKSGIADVFKKYSKDIEYDVFNRHRNEIVHRGRILDKEVLDLKIEWNRLYSRKHSFLTKEPISDDEYKAGIAELNQKTVEIAAAKQEHYTVHYEKTLVLVGEMLRMMARKTADLYKKDAV